MNTNPFPITRSLKLAYILSLIIVLLMGSFSLSGLLFQSLVYPNEALRQSFVSNDVVNLCIVLPILLGSLALTRRGRLIGLLFWPAALFCVTYNYIAYLLITPAWVIGGVLLWRHKALGYVTGAGLLFQASMLFVGLLIYFIFQPLLAKVPFPAQDFAVIFGMGLVCFIPFGLFLHGLLDSRA
jgi:hypothetical protein